MYRLNRIESAFLTVACLVLLVSVLPWINQLGMEYDECHFLDTAMRIAAKHPEYLKPPDGLYISGRPFPFMTMPYVGALDGWLMAIPVALFGHSPAVPRLVNTATAFAVLYLAYVLARRFGDSSRRLSLAGVLAVVMLLVDFEFILHVPPHFGPFLFQMICGALVVLELDRWLETASPSRFYWACCAAGFGFQEKLTFVWMLALITLGFLVFRGREVLARLTFRTFAIGLVVFFVSMTPVLIYVIGRPEIVFGYGSTTTHAPTIATLVEKFRMFYHLLAGQQFAFQQLGAIALPERFSALPWLLGGALVLSVAARERMTAMLMTIALALVALNALFADGGRLHHLLLAYPLLQAGMAAALVRWRATAATALILLAATGVSTGQNLAAYSKEAARSGGAGHWSSAIYDLARWIEQRPEKFYVSSAWGFYRPLYFLTGGKIPIHDRYFSLVPDKPGADVTEDLDRFLTRRNVYWIRSSLIPQYDVNYSHLLLRAAAIGLSPTHVASFDTKLGERIYEVVTFHPDDTKPWRPVAGHAAGARDLQFAVPPGTREVRFELNARRWDRGQGFTVELLDAADQRLVAYWRPADWAPFPWPWQRVEFGPDLYPDYFTKLAGAKAGEVRKVALTLDTRQSKPADIAIRRIEVR